MITGPVIITAVVAFLLGAGVERVRRAWSDWRTTKRAVPVLRSAWWAAFKRVVAVGLVAAMLAVIGAMALLGQLHQP